jgi:hypothetical protein
MLRARTRPQARPAQARMMALSSVSLIGGDHDARARCAGLEQPQRSVRAAGKQPPSSPQHQRSDHQEVLVDHIGRHQRADQHAATHDHQIRLRALLEIRDSARNVAVQQSRVRPVERCRGPPRGDVLADIVERVPERAAVGRSSRPATARSSTAQTATRESRPLARPTACRSRRPSTHPRTESPSRRANVRPPLRAHQRPFGCGSRRV